MEKFRLFKVRLESGVTRTVVALSLADVTRVTFSAGPDAALEAAVDEIAGIEAAGTVDLLLLPNPGNGEAPSEVPSPAPALHLVEPGVV